MNAKVCPIAHKKSPDAKHELHGVGGIRMSQLGWFWSEERVVNLPTCKTAPQIFSIEI